MMNTANLHTEIGSRPSFYSLHSTQVITIYSVYDKAVVLVYMIYYWI